MLKWILTLVICCFMVLIGNPVSADVDAQLQLVLKRLEVLEKENAALKQTVMDLQKRQAIDDDRAEKSPNTQAQSDIQASSTVREDALPKEGAGLFTTLTFIPHMEIDDGGTSYVIVNNGGAALYNGSIKTVEPDSDDAWRLGIGYRLPWENWDVQFRHFSFSTKTMDETSVGAGQDLHATRIHPDQFANNTEGNFDIARSEVSYDIKNFGLEVGRRLIVTNDFSARLFGGLLWSDIDRDLATAYLDAGSTQATYVDEKLDFNGVGLRLGVSSDWYMGKGVRLFGGLAYSAIVGETKFQIRETDVAPDSLNFDLEDKYDDTLQLVELTAGLGYDWKINEHLALSVETGYEFSRYSGLSTTEFNDDIMEASNNRSDFDLDLHGWFARMKLEF